MRFVFHICIMLTIAGCQALQIAPKPERELSLRLAKEMYVGKTRQSEILSRLGKPDRVFNLSETNLGGNGQIWAYIEGDIQSSGRISFSFPENSDVIDSVTWDVREGDPEQSIENALAQFKNSDFVKTRPKYWDNPHSGPNELFYEDNKNGLTITYLKTPKQVTAISWASPYRSTTTDLNPIASAPHPYCIVGICATPLKQ